jgi:hypothetical protein
MFFTEEGKVHVFDAATGAVVGTHWSVDARDIVNQSEGAYTLEPPTAVPTTGEEPPVPPAGNTADGNDGAQGTDLGGDTGN